MSAKSVFAASVSAIVMAGLLVPPDPAASQARRAAQQVVNPAPVTYWMDVSTGENVSPGLGGFAGMMGGMGGGAGASGYGPAFGGRDNWFGAAQQPTPGRFTDIAIFDSRQPGRVAATQSVPAGARLGPTLPLLAPPPPTTGRSPWEESEPRPPGEPGERPPRIVIKYYWGCSAAVATGQPRTVTFDPGNMRAYGEFMAGRSVRDRGATSNGQASFWPNRDSNRAWPDSASLVGGHSVTGAGLPASLAFQIGAANDFMGRLGLTSAGSPTGVLTLNWTALPTASAYFANAMGMEMNEGMGGGRPEEITMILWSASQTPDPGDGLMTFLSNANQERFLADRTLLSASTTSCQIPSGIFAQAMMINIGAIAYGRELNLVHPPRPTDPRVAWNQEWTARLRVKSEATLLLMPGMGAAATGATRGSGRAGQPAPPPPLTEAQIRALPPCRGAARAIGGALGRAALGRASGGLLGNSPPPPPEQPGVNCRPQ